MNANAYDRIWPDELAVHQSNPAAIPMLADGRETECLNCGGSGVMMVYLVERGPLRSPSGKCKWLDFADPRKSGWYAGELVVAHCPVCHGGQWEAFLTKNCGLTGADLRVTLDEFKPKPGKAQALKAARELLAAGAEPAGFVTFYGAYGTGKSHLLKGLVNGFRAAGVRARYATLPDLLADIRDRFGDDRGGVAVEEAIDAYQRIPVLAVDEVADPDRANLTGWAKETIFRLLDARYNRRSEVLTAMASNVRPEQMTAEWGYLRSRMGGGLVVEVGGEDMRPYIQPTARTPKDRNP